jgi:hypothetical protein
VVALGVLDPDLQFAERLIDQANYFARSSASLRETATRLL